MWRGSAVAVFAALLVCATAYNNGLGAKPPMGWNTWCTDDLCGLIDKCTDALIRQQAKAMAEYNLTALGYEYVNMDDCWSAKTRDANGDLQPDPKRFPYGMKDLADYVHSLGLKIGVYTCIGTKTCRLNRPGSFGNYERDANTLASWGIDFVKADNCAKPAGFSEYELYKNFSHYLNATGRPMLFSLCEWGDANVQTWGAEVSQMYRIQMDHLPFWDLATHAAGKGFGQGTLNIIKYVSTLKPSTFVKQYGWMDPDFLMTLFWPTMNEVHSRTEFTFWAAWSSPLIISTPINNMSQAKLDIISNEEVIAINRDDLNTAADIQQNISDGRQVWTKPLANGDYCVIFFNANTWKDVDITVVWSDLLNIKHGAAVRARDLWKRQDLGILPSIYMAEMVDSGAVRMLRVTPVWNVTA